jgi:hypothetical protein
MKRLLMVCALVVIGITIIAEGASRASANASFDHEYRSFAQVLKKHVRYPRVDYAALKQERTCLRAIGFGRQGRAGDRPAAGHLRLVQTRRSLSRLRLVSERRITTMTR